MPLYVVEVTYTDLRDTWIHMHGTGIVSCLDKPYPLYNFPRNNLDFYHSMHKVDIY